MQNMMLNEIGYLLLVAISSVVALFIVAKILGKKQISQLNFVDYIIGISIGSIAAEMATDINEKPMWYYLIAIGIYFLFDWIISFIERKSPALKRFFEGRPLTIIYEGKINYKALKKSKLDVNSLLMLARKKDFFDLEDVAFAIFENDGSLTILPKDAKRPTVAEDFNIQLRRSSLPVYLIIDGEISWSSLNELEKDVDWLYKKVNINNRKDLKNIILASYDEEEDHININYKRQARV